MLSEPLRESHPVLLVDDDELIVDSLRGYLGQIGIAVDAARGGVEAGTRMREARYDLILADPYLTGEASRANALVHEIRELQPDATVILLSAYHTEELAVVAREHAISGFISKPKPIPFLAEMIAGVLSARHGAEAHRRSS